MERFGPVEKKATAALKKLIGKHEVECTDEGEDKYGRTLSICYANGVDLQSEMVRTGMAVAYIRYSTRYEEEMIEAMINRAGIWSGDFLDPEDWEDKIESEINSIYPLITLGHRS